MKKKNASLRTIITRVVVDIFILGCIFMAPWWVAIILAIAASFFFDTYIEVILAGIIIDSIYATQNGVYLHIHYLLTLVTLVIYLVTMPIKERLR